MAIKCRTKGVAGKVYECQVDISRRQSRCVEKKQSPISKNICPHGTQWHNISRGYQGYQYSSFERSLHQLDKEFRSLSPQEQVDRLGKTGTLKTGQLIFQSIPVSYADSTLGLNLIRVLNRAMDSEINHVGIIVYINRAWRVIEAEASGVRYTKLKDFIGRNVNKYWIKEFTFFKNNSESAKKFVTEAHKYYGKPYDYKYKDGEDAISCTELVDIALKKVGHSADNVKVPVSWLNGYDKSVRLYLAMVHQIMDLDDLPPSWILLPPHTLFYSDDLKDPEVLPFGFINIPNKSSLKNNMLFDIIPGRTREEKYNHVRNKWSGRMKTPSIFSFRRGRNYCYQFRFLEKGKDGTLMHSVTLFAEFPEERALAKDFAALYDLHM